MSGFESKILTIEQASGIFLGNDRKSSNDVSKISPRSFREIFEETSQNVRFSKHANERLSSRNINLSHNQMDRLNQGINQAREKQINESLVVMDNLAFIVNVKNNMVVTALEQGDEGNVFTNIDGAVIV